MGRNVVVAVSLRGCTRLFLPKQLLRFLTKSHLHFSKAKDKETKES